MGARNGCGGVRRGDRGLREPCSRADRGSLAGGQSTLEYALFVTVVAAALTAMNVYVRRSIQANLKVLEDQLNASAVAE